MNLSFAGCGFLGVYHIGVASCLRKYSPDLCVKKISGASAGAIAACFLLSNTSLCELTSDVLNLITQARTRPLGPFTPSFNLIKILKACFQRLLPDNVHELVNGRLHISMTEVRSKQNVIVNHFDSKEEVIQALLCSSFIPLFCGIVPPKFRGSRYMDGGLSDNLINLDDDTITVSPFCGESDICPKDCDFPGLWWQISLANMNIKINHENLYRFCCVLFPPSAEYLAKLCQKGFDDALYFLQHNNLISCANCFAVRSVVNMENSCLACLQQQEEAMIAELPDVLKTLLQKTIDDANKGVLNWLYKFHTVRFISLLTLPYILPVDFAYATFQLLIEMLPKIKDETMIVIGKLIRLMLGKFNANHITAKLVLQLAGDKLREEEPLGFDFNVNSLELLNLEYPQSHAQAYKISAELKNQANHLQHQTNTYDNKHNAFENMLEITKKENAVISFYYLDDINQLNVTEIFETGTY